MNPFNVQFNGLPAVRLTLPDGSSAVVSAHGAQVLSWQPVGSGELLYMSPLAKFDAGASIRGGIPVMFPQFSERGSLPKHGFVRRAVWNLLDVEQNPEAPDGGRSSVRFGLSSSPETLALWPHPFTAVVTVLLTKGRLAVSLDIHNTGDTALEFTGALHSYLRVGDIATASLTGLTGVQRQPAAGGPITTETANEITVSSLVDTVYLNVPRPLLLTHGHHALGIAAEGFADVVVWKPWTELSAALPDMPDDGYRSMLCVEAATVVKPVRVEAGARWRGSQTLSTLDAV